MYVDFSGPFHGKTYFIVMDASITCLEVYEVSDIGAETTVSRLKEYCSRYELSKLLVFDNDRHLILGEMECLCLENQLRHNFGASYHPSTNRATKNAVKSVKANVKKVSIDLRNNPVEEDLLMIRYLFV